MKFLANENFPFPSIQLLRESGIDVLSIAEKFPGISDHDVIEIALKKDLIILTFDKDYGEIIFKEKIKSPPAVVFFKYKGKETTFAGKIIDKIFEDKSILLDDKFTVIEEKNIRQRSFNL
jgi:predicted nuclease of predicted toxin-antitoxin system